MAFVNINTDVRLVLTKYGKRKLAEGNLSITYFGISDTVRYDLDEVPTKIIDTQGGDETNFYNGNNSTVTTK